MSDEQKAQAIDYLVLAKLINQLVVDTRTRDFPTVSYIPCINNVLFVKILKK